MSVLKRLIGSNTSKPKHPIAPGAQDFIDGKKDTLTFADVDPEGAALFQGFQKAMVLKKEGKFREAETLLLKSTNPSSIYKGHYKELFKIWRKHNRDELKANKFEDVESRVLNMIRLDEEMIKTMLLYWGGQQKRKLPSDYFDKDRNILISDAKALKKAAESLGNKNNVVLAEKLLKKFKTL
ncbi:hypothetical protein C7Y69_14860 [Alteromonas sp. KS69]|uniref:hypothetical protein n=1 Tax=Alteromonas sp. KS69 TaxID=2109917 RepID=UPI000F872CA0|nr:hypothetical protein [Alteromonas sp. KS69]RUP78613.1 hypothetical protein C7Y69_14860 [Alteromonas sp. KS69]|tara:strand:- start:26025 stop:26570 length:546 start_codon:yes stop_codon:yes gene_type:complete